MAEHEGSAEVAAAIRELAKQVDAHSKATVAAAEILASAISKGINVQVAPQPGYG